MRQPPPDPIFTFRGESAFNSVHFYECSGREKLLSSAADGSVTLWDLKTLTLASTWKAHSGSCHWADVWKPTGQIATQGRDTDCQLKLWNVEKETEVYSAQWNYTGFCRCTIQGDILAAPGENTCEVILLDMKNGNKVASLRPSNNMGTTMSMHWMDSSNDFNLVVCYEDGNVIMWNTKKQQEVSSCKIEGDTPMAITWHHNKGFLSTSGYSQHLLELDSDILKVKQTIDLKNSGSSSCSVRSDGRILATGGWDYRIRLFSWKSLKPLGVLMHHSKTVEDIQFSTQPLTSWKGKYALACAGGDKMISLWDLYNT